MPTNVTMEYTLAERKYQQATTPNEKLLALNEMYAEVPKHKGTETLRSEIKKKISVLKKSLEKQSSVGKRNDFISVKKEGAAQVVIVGSPNSGKSTFLSRISNKDVTIADYPFTTNIPEVAMGKFEDIQFQFVEIPAITENFYSRSLGGQLFGVIRNSDLIMILSKNDSKLIHKELKSALIKENKKPKKISFNKAPGGINITGIEKLKDGSLEEAELILKENAFVTGFVIIYEEVTLEEFADAINDSLVYKPSITIINDEIIEKIDSNEEYDLKLSDGSEKIFSLIWKKLGRIRCYTKIQGERASKIPITLEENSTIEELATKVHKDLLSKFKYARIWGNSKFPGQKVGKDFVLSDKDTVEIHTR